MLMSNYKVIGYLFTKKNTDKGVKLEFWSDENGKWVKLADE